MSRIFWSSHAVLEVDISVKVMLMVIFLRHRLFIFNRQLIQVIVIDVDGYSGQYSGIIFFGLGDSFFCGSLFQ